MTLAAITMTAPEAASPVQMYRATYSPDDNKLRLYAVSRLDPETYKKVHDAGFRWAPKQALFVAPAWTPGREDVLLSLAGEIEDEDSTLAERQEARAERFTGYSGKRASESAQALDEVERLAAMIPPGQPILVGHHSERRARRDAQRIENGMKRAVMLFERAEYWEERARSALLHAKYKERPDVRWRRIKKIEADLRKAEKTIAQSQKYLTMWRAESLDLNMAKLISSHDHISACFPLDTYPRPAEKSQYEGSRSLWSALDDDIITTEQAREIAIRCHERQIQHQQRWVNHYQNRLIYERAMLDESGGVVTRTQDFEPGGQVFSRGEWLTIIRVNKSNGAVSSVTTPNYSFLGYEGNILFAFAVAAQVLTWCETRSGWRTAAAILLMALWGPLSGTSYGIAGLLMLAVSHRLYRAEDRAERLALVACLLAVIPALNLATSDAAAVAGLVMTVLTVGLVSCAGKSLPRFWPGDFFPVFYACHLAVLGVLAL